MTKLNPDSGIALFTDGSCNHRDKIGGFAWIAIDAYDGEEWGSGSELSTTNNRMEMLAWIQGLRSLGHDLGPCEVLVYSDSELVGKGFEGQISLRKNQDLWKQLFKVAKVHSSVEWIWVKGHSDSFYNQKADKLANEARKKRVKRK